MGSAHDPDGAPVPPVPESPLLIASSVTPPPEDSTEPRQATVIRRSTRSVQGKKRVYRIAASGRARADMGCLRCLMMRALLRGDTYPTGTADGPECSRRSSRRRLRTPGPGFPRRTRRWRNTPRSSPGSTAAGIRRRDRRPGGCSSRQMHTPCTPAPSSRMTNPTGRSCIGLHRSSRSSWSCCTWACSSHHRRAGERRPSGRSRGRTPRTLHLRNRTRRRQCRRSMCWRRGSTRCSWRGRSSDPG